MTGLEFYEKFKDALDYLGPGFRQMEEVQISLHNEFFHMTAGGKVVAFKLPIAQPFSTWSANHA